MNSLEFIDREIEEIEREIKYKKLYIENNANDNSLKLELISNMIGSLEKKLSHLQQIKSELEAWDVVSNPHNIIEFGDGILEIWYDTKKEENILKKALEVEENE